MKDNNGIEELEPVKQEETQEIEDLTTPDNQNKGDVNYVKKISKYLDEVPDHTKDYGWKEIEDGQVMSYLCYLSILVLIPVLTKNQNNYVKYNINQGLNLLLLEIGAGVILAILGAIFIYTITWIVTILSTLVAIIFFSFSVIGIFNVYNGDAKELPLINKFKIIK